jgi:hypothetical protein
MPSEALPESLPRFQAEQYAFTGWLRRPTDHTVPPGIEARRLAIYRELFFNNIASFVENGFPILQSLLPADLWRRLSEGFFADHRCHTPYFHEISEEFVRYFNSLDWPELAVLPWARELVHFEWVELEADIAEAGEGDDIPASSAGDLLAGIPLVSSLAWPLVYHWPVHRFAAEGVPEHVPEQPSCLLVYRDADDDVQLLDITPLTAHLLESLRANVTASGHELLTAIALQAGYADIPAFVSAGAGILAELHAVGVIRGTRYL